MLYTFNLETVDEAHAIDEEVHHLLEDLRPAMQRTAFCSTLRPEMLGRIRQTSYL